ncbi:prepilin-type N-terminal cleavage/methylation domain-containing protein [Pseudoalteromonas sp. B28]|uniref:prepilin-type N-terminal cleavage/methylation domain-containing protein n=1 Tax=Pseudoalteromonas sp. SR43-3 TaxID=2760943 RepID=UPI001601A1FE|nr:prepilin-type N-terminal cleavage/methylation domain-containing protein [Pseudoalteromonas sp. SR43-3]MBB1275852.1 prepilin-type N-terminal cleavage/methylation domain-containing protein [Pseudoalteromonas sp. SR43-3]
MKTQSLKSLPMNKQAGFTLVELIIVIVILGILAVTAAPRFLNLQGDANASTLEGLQGSIRSGMNIVNGKAIIASTQKEDTEIVAVDTGNVAIVYGYPAATEAAFEAFLDVDFDGTGADLADFNLVVTANGTNGPTNAGSVPKVTIYPNSYTATGTPATDDECRIEYTEATASTGPVKITPPKVELFTDDC